MDHFAPFLFLKWLPWESGHMKSIKKKVNVTPLDAPNNLIAGCFSVNFSRWQPVFPDPNCDREGLSSRLVSGDIRYVNHAPLCPVAGFKNSLVTLDWSLFLSRYSTIFPQLFLNIFVYYDLRLTSHSWKNVKTDRRKRENTHGWWVMGSCLSFWKQPN